MTRTSDPLPGAPRTERYEIREGIGQGAMGLVYRAFDRKAMREVALKTLRFPDPDEIYRLKQEFRSLRDLSHRNLARLIDLDVVEDRCFFTMELIDGIDFLTYVRGELGDPRDPSAATCDYRRIHDALAQLALGLRALHDAGKVHRDVKPTNVLVERSGRVVLLDFGLVSETRSSRSFDSANGGFVGTLDYAAPEQVFGQPVFPAADWYSVGVMLYEALTGRLPFAGSLAAVFQAKQQRPAQTPITLVPSVPAPLSALVEHLLEPSPDARAGFVEVLRTLDRDVRTPAMRLAETVPYDEGPFVGRTAELARLASLMESVRAGTPAVVHVCGPSGMGKSELVRRFVARAHVEHSPLILEGRCHPQESVSYKALDPLLDELSRHLRRLSHAEVAAVAPRHTAALLRLFPVLGRVPALARMPSSTLAVEPQELRRQGLNALRELLTRVADRRILLLWIDDAQWGDRDSAPLLRELVRPPDAPRVMLVLSYRSGDEQGNPLLSELVEHEARLSALHHRLDLGPLAPDETRALADELLHGNRPAGDPHVTAIVEESAGSPFFVGELIRYLASREPSADDEPSAPLSVAEVVRARLLQLGDDSRAVLDLVAVSGGPIDMELVLELCGLNGGGRRTVEELCLQCLLRASVSGDRERLETYHDRIRETVLATLDAAALRQRHRLIADGLRARASSDPQALVDHYLGAGDETLAAEYARQAAGAAVAALAFDRAADLYGLALRLRGNRDSDWPLQVEWAEALGNAGRGAEAGLVYEQAAASVERAAPNSRTQSMLKGRAAEQYLYAGRLEQGLAVLRSVLESLGDRVPQTANATRRASIALRLRLLLRGFRFTPRTAASIPADALIRLDALWGASKGTIMLDFALSDVFSLRHLLGALKVGEPSRVLRALGVEASAEANFGGSWLRRRSEAMFTAVDELAAQTGHPYDRAWVNGSRAGAAYFSARWRNCLALCERAIEIFTTECAGVAWEVTVNHTFALAALGHLGRIRELSSRLPALLDDARSRGDRHALAVVRTGHTVLVPLAMDDPAGALEAAESTLQFFPSPHFTSQNFHHLLATVQTHLYTGDGGRAWALVESSWPSIRAVGFLYLDCLGLQLRYLRALAALAAAATQRTTVSRDGLLEVAATEARRIARSSLPIAAPFAAAIRAGHAAVLDDRGGYAQALRLAMTGFDRADMVLHHQATRMHLASVETGAEAQDLSSEGSVWMQNEGIRNPKAMARTLVPPLWVVAVT